MELVSQYEIENNVIGTCQDTTSSNTGCHSGAVVRFQKHYDRQLLQLDCRRHVKELHVGHFATEIRKGQGTRSPGDELFKLLKKHWEVVSKNIDVSKLCSYKPAGGEDGFIGRKMAEVLSLCKSMLNNNTFPRADYLYMVKLIVAYLSGNFANFRFRPPITVSHARFLQEGIYFLTFQLLKGQLSLLKLSKQQEWEIEQLAEFCALFYGPAFLQSSLGTDAALNDLHDIRDLREYERHYEHAEYHVLHENNEYNREKLKLNAVRAAINNMILHADYVSAPNVVMSLASDKMKREDKQEIVDALLLTIYEEDIDTSFPFKKHLGKEKKVELFLKLWPSNVTFPSWSQFVTADSWLLFKSLGILDVEALSWMTEDPEDWYLDDNYRRFREFIKAMEVVNDAAERSVKLCSENLKFVTSEETFQNKVQVVHQVRKHVPNNKHGKVDKDVLKNVPVGKH